MATIMKYLVELELPRKPKISAYVYSKGYYPVKCACQGDSCKKAKSMMYRGVYGDVKGFMIDLLLVK